MEFGDSLSLLVTFYCFLLFFVVSFSCSCVVADVVGFLLRCVFRWDIPVVVSVVMGGRPIVP